MVKIYVQGKVKKEIYNEFVKNAFFEYGPKQGYKGLAIEDALQLYNSFFTDHNGTRFVDIVKNNGYSSISEWGEDITKEGVHGFKLTKNRKKVL